MNIWQTNCGFADFLIIYFDQFFIKDWSVDAVQPRGVYANQLLAKVGITAPEM